MRVLMVDNIHLVVDKCGIYYAPSIYSYEFLQRYLVAFDSVKIVAKVKKVEKVDKKKYNIVSGPGVEVVELPWYQGLVQMIRKLPQLMRIYRKIGNDVDCYVFRIAQVESFFTYLLNKNDRKPFAVEVVNDPETFVDMNWIMRVFSVKMVKRMCAKATGVSYVTKESLQKKYPSYITKDSTRFESYYSSVSLEDKDIVREEKEFEENSTLNIVHVSNAINSDIKGHSTLIEVGRILSQKGLNFHISFIGDGTLVDYYKKMVQEYGLTESITFVGRLSNKEELFGKLKESDLMVLPTKMEGLPRTIIEAMANGLPCLSTPIAGIPELLSRDYLYDADDVEGFAKKIIELAGDPKQLREMSKDNITKANDYKKSILEKRRTEFYNNLRKRCN